MARHLAPAPSLDIFDGTTSTTSLAATLLADSYSRAGESTAVGLLDMCGDVLTAEEAASLADEHSTSLARLADDEGLRPTGVGMFWTVDVLLALGY